MGAQRIKDEKWELLLEAAKKISSDLPVDELLIFLSDTARDLLEVDRCSLFLADKEKKVLWTKVAHGVSKIVVPWDKGVVGWVYQNRQELIVHDAYKDFRFNPEVDKKTGYHTRNILAVPLKDRQGNMLGVYQAINKLDGDFTEEDLRIFTIIGAYAASAIENSMLYHKLKKAYEETIVRLAYAAEYKDKETKNHIIRTGLFAEVIGRKLGLDDKECEKLLLAVPMHDIGKIGVPDSILLKPGKLTEEEWQIMKSHTIIGYNILKDSESELLQAAALVALEHHENVNGTGYPYGKKEKELSIYGMIAAAVDVFDALTSARPYKPAWPLEKVLKVFEEEKEKKFQKEIAEVLIENAEELMKIREKFPDETQEDLRNISQIIQK